jgi:DNA-binding CsgD family transcriptional regulator
MARRKKGPPGAPAHGRHHAVPPAEVEPSSTPKVVYDPDEQPQPPPHLTLREDEINFWVVRGKDNAEVARILSANPETVRKHVENIRVKYGVESRPAILAAYGQHEVDSRDRLIHELEAQVATLQTQLRRGS